ncbi:unnamed protein product [Schistocephalus solidus]|uniref:Non-structural maintenance of chromosomes element 2 homolog n=1 Tax=Schistocephalus solidus TaxID=70667 RepID=A0A183SKN7_SCHSO|nr:unnamed protein product [Schistocephalus solidus]
MTVHAVRVLKEKLTLEKALKFVKKAEETDDLSSSEPTELGRAFKRKQARNMEQQWTALYDILNEMRAIAVSTTASQSSCRLPLCTEEAYNDFLGRMRQTGRMLGSCIFEHKLAVRRGDCLTQVAAHTYETCREFNFAATKIIAHARCKKCREVIEVWASDENSVNRLIDLAPAYRAPCIHHRTGATAV